jgi:hypothetical protein
MSNRMRIVLAAVAAASLFGARGDVDRPYLRAALKAARWIESRGAAAGTPEGRNALPGVRHSDASLYSGTPGVVFFFIEAYYGTGERGYLDKAISVADGYAASLTADAGAGLYEGLSGI